MISTVALTPSSVVDASMALTDRAPERVKSVPLSRPTWTARHGDLACPVNAVDENAGGRKSQVATLAGRNNQSEVRQIGCSVGSTRAPKPSA